MSDKTEMDSIETGPTFLSQTRKFEVEIEKEWSGVRMRVVVSGDNLDDVMKGAVELFDTCAHKD